MSVEMPPELPFALGLPILGAVFVLFLLSYAYFAYCLQLVAKKAGIVNEWFAWVPIMNVILMCDIAGKERWWTALALGSGLIPMIGGIASVVIFAIIFWDMCLKRGKPGWIGIGMVLPFIQFAAWGYLAFSE